jgi:hypothetical protein
MSRGKKLDIFIGADIDDGWAQVQIDLKLTFFKTVDSLLIGNTTDHKRNFNLGGA